jgi:putative membrane protein
MRRTGVLFSRFILTAAITSLPVAMLAQTNKPSAGTAIATTTSADRKFVRAAAQGGVAEVELGKLAAEKGFSEDVKKFGQRMVDDHTKAGDQLKDIASRKGITVPTKLSAKDRMTKDRLSKLSGDPFDQAYMNDMVKDHTQDVADFKRESSSGTDSDVKNFASSNLPTIEDHLREARKITPKTTSASNNMKGSQ